MKKILTLLVIIAVLFTSLIMSPTYAASNPYVGGNSNCTYTAWRLVKEHTGIELPGFTGNAAGWYQGAINYGYAVGGTPQPDSVVVYDRDVNGYGHVAYVTAVNGNQIYVQEGGYLGGYHEGWTQAYGKRAETGTILGYIYLKNNVYPSQPTLNVSAGDSTKNTTLSWNATANTNYYDLRIYNSDGSLYLSKFYYTGTSYSVKLPVGSYYANVASVNNNGNYVFSANVNFSVNVAKPGKPTLTINSSYASSPVAFSWKPASNTSYYNLKIYKDSSTSVYKNITNIKNTNYSLSLPVGKYYAQLTAYSSASSIYTTSDNVKFEVLTNPQISSDGWYYVDKLPSNVNSSNYTIQYKNITEKVSSTSPGSGFTKGGLVKSQYENNGAPYWTKIELPTSNTRVLLSYYYYHYCGASTGLYANFEMSGNYQHEDQITDVNSVTIAQTGMDGNHVYYYLKWKNGNWAKCKSGVTCDGSYGTHGERSYAWYRNSQYQDKKLVNYYKYTKASSWVNTKDSNATTVKYRYKEKYNNNFVDVDTSSWYYETIKEAYNLKLMTGTDSTHFSPDKQMSRGMVATVLYRMAGAPNVTGKSKFSDVKDGLWYSKAITWAANSGIISGYQNGKFGPDDNVTREQMAVMLRNYAMKRGLDTKTTNNLTKFKDYKNVTSYAKSAMGWAVDKGIISGANNGTRLNPTSNATRAECAKMLVQFYKLI